MSWTQHAPQAELTDVLNDTSLVTSTGLQVTAISGNLVDFQADALVNTTGDDLDLSIGAMASAFLKAAGPSIQDECHQNAPNGIKPGEVIQTRGYKLKCKSVFHTSLPSWSTSTVIHILQAVMQDILQQADSKGYSSVAFPALGTGQLGYDRTEVASAMFTAVADYANIYTNSSIKAVTFVIFNKDSPTIQAFKDEISSLCQASDLHQEEKQPADLAGWDPEKGFDLTTVDPALKLLFAHAGVSEEQLQDKETADFIYRFIQDYGGLEQIKQEVDTQRSPPPQPSTLERARHRGNATRKQRSKKKKRSAPQPPADQATPAAKQTTPDTDQATPDADQTTPGADQSTQDTDQATPDADQATPADVVLDVTSDEARESTQLEQGNSVVANDDDVNDGGDDGGVDDGGADDGSADSGAGDAANWVEHTTPSGNVYYVNVRTQQSVWEKPEGFKNETTTENDGDGGSEVGGADDGGADDGGADDDGDDEWSEHETDDGELYYYNARTQQSVWENPKIYQTWKRLGAFLTKQLPSTWSEMPPHHVVARFELSSDSREYTGVATNFTNSLNIKRTILRIERIQNPRLYLGFCNEEMHMNAVNGPGTKNRRTLWHGTTSDAVDDINATGFNRSYCGKNAVAFGQGVYFARDASYSDDGTYAVRDATGQKRMYQCLVLTGEMTEGDPYMKAPPTRDAERNIKYDSTVNDVHDPTIFVVFGDYRAYPEYLITYK